MKVIIEIPEGSQYKYEVDKKTGKLVLDRPINQKCPANYGYIPGTLHDDGDPLDVFTLSNQPLEPLSECQAEPLALLYCFDNGVTDNKVIAKLSGEMLSHHRDLYIEKIINYLSTYKKGFTVEGISYDQAEISKQVGRDMNRHDIGNSEDKLIIKPDENGLIHLDDFKSLLDISKVEYYSLKHSKKDNSLTLVFYDKNKKKVKLYDKTKKLKNSQKSKKV